MQIEDESIFTIPAACKQPNHVYTADETGNNMASMTEEHIARVNSNKGHTLSKQIKRIMSILT